jgi:hypothetical protein
MRGRLARGMLAVRAKEDNRFAMRTLGLSAVPLGCALIAVSCGQGPQPYSTFSGDAGRPGVDAGPESGDLVGDAHGPCVNLQCQQVDCAAQNLPDTTVTGRVFDPAGVNPLYDVIVYVPNDTVKPLTPGVVCDQCGVLASGSPVVTALTGPDGRFVLHDVPSGDAIPLVIQLGKWRKQLVIPHVAQCQDTPMSDPSKMRMPAKQSEGDMPQMAIATGGCDPFECLLRKIGIDASEFTTEADGGRVHLYQGVGGSGLQGSTGASQLWASKSLSTYDMIINACECHEEAQEKPQTSIDNLVAYADSGGRIFNTHYQYYWIDPTQITVTPPVATNPAWQSTAVFVPEQNGTSSIVGFVDTTFPKGDAFSQWLMNVGASSSLDRFPIDQARYNVQSANPPSTRWVSNPNTGDTQTTGPALLHYTFNTPVGLPEPAQCGKVLFSDFHVVSSLTSSPTFPSECDGQPMTPQELALEFMLFDLSACIQVETQPPKPPPPIQ